MKTVSSLMACLAFAAFVSLPAAAAPMAPAVFAESPDHPSTWVNGADNVHQDLRWDVEKHMLFADVKYSTVEYADDTHPTEESDYALSFPMVHFDPASNRFSVHGVTVGTLRHGFFGAEVVLDRGIELSIHRHHGRISAMIIPSENE